MELERIYTTQLYLEKLSNGIDPFTGEDLPEDSLYNNVSLCRSFRTAADLLGEIIANRGQLCRFRKSRSASPVLPFACIKYFPQTSKASRPCR